MKLPVIQQLVITDGLLAFDEQRRGLTLEAAVNAREAAGGAAGFLLDGRGTVNGAPLTLKIEGGPSSISAATAPIGSRPMSAGRDRR